MGNASGKPRVSVVIPALVITCKSHANDLGFFFNGMIYAMQFMILCVYCRMKNIILMQQSAGNCSKK